MEVRFFDNDQHPRHGLFNRKGMKMFNIWIKYTGVSYMLSRNSWEKRNRICAYQLQNKERM